MTMLSLVEQPVLDLTVLVDMYGDDSAETVCFALSGFNREAQRYVCQLQQALTQTIMALSTTYLICLNFALS